MPTQILPTTGPGAADQWVAAGAASSWEAVLRGSGDSSYIEASVSPAVSTFFCGSGTKPIPGRIVGITLHYRIRATTSTGAFVLFIISQDGTDYSVSPPFAVPVGWSTGEIRIRDSWSASGTRPTVQDVYNLGVGVSLLAGPGAGSVQVSELWVEVETVDTPYCYDPMDGVLPDAVVGPLQWSTIGTQPASITVDKYLEIIDSSPIDSRIYHKQVAFPFPDYYVTEIEARFWVQTVAPGQVLLADIFALRLGTEAISVPILRTPDGHDWIGLVPGDLEDLSAYLGAYQQDISGQHQHLRIVIDRDPDPASAGQVSLYLNYQDTPIIQVPYLEFINNFPSIPGNIFFGAFPHTESFLRYDYLAYKTYKKRSGEFKGWSEQDFVPNAVQASSTDPDIVYPVLVQPPGIFAGQSRHCCVLDMQDPQYPCGVVQSIQLPAGLPTTYEVALDYKVLSPGPQAFELVIQRESDLWYWDTGTVSWVSAFTPVVVPYSPARARASLVTGLGVASPEAVLISVQGILGPAAAHQILIYKVYLREE